MLTNVCNVDGVVLLNVQRQLHGLEVAPNYVARHIPASAAQGTQRVHASDNDTVITLVISCVWTRGITWNAQT